MREILFKGKRKDNGEWVEGYYLKHETKCYICPVICDVSYGDNGNRIRFGCWYVVDPETVCQYINKDDINGTKIFEGNILRYFDNEIQVVEWNKEFGQIMLHTYSEYEHKKGKKVLKEIHDGWHYLDDYPLEEMCIIGNIHDNPELLLEVTE